MKCGVVISIFAHPGMQALEQMRVVGWRKLSRRHGFVVGPHANDEAVTNVGTRLHPRVERGHRAIGFGEPRSDLDFQRGASCQMERGRDPGNDVARHQVEDEPVRIVQNDRVVDCQVKG